MTKKKLINSFCSGIMSEEKRKNKVTISGISTTLIAAALNHTYVNESCKSSGMVSKSQVIYRKLKDISKEELQNNFRKHSIKLMKMLKIFSRGRKFIISFDETEEDYWGELNKKENNLFIHNGCDNPKAKYHYYYLAVAITGNDGTRYILDAKILARGEYIEDAVYDMAKFVREHLPIDVALFDRGFGWGVIYKLQKLKINYMVFWKKSGKWYKKYFEKLGDGRFCCIKKERKYNRNMACHKVKSNFIFVKQLEHEGKKYDWIFATSLKLDSAEKYVGRYKKRWGIETIFRVNDNIRIYTTSTNPAVRYFLFLFTCFVYNVWKFFQSFIGEDFTLGNFCTVFIIYLFERGFIEPIHYGKFERIAEGLIELDGMGF